MLNIYQEFVRNHQYSLQILAHCKQNRDFDKLLKHYEAKPDCEERTLETFLTYPMFQVGPGPACRARGCLEDGVRAAQAQAGPRPPSRKPGWGAPPSGALSPAGVLGLENRGQCCSVPVPAPPQIPRYILTLHELLAHTPHEHVERNSLDYAKSKLEELSR